jgi:60 kDa SS-A/Ro ribonucleoprotein
MPHNGTDLGGAVTTANRVGYDRLIVFTDEQSHSPVGNPLAGKRGYMVNVSAERNGVGYGKWLHLDGFSEHVLGYVRAVESSEVDTEK